jgi:cytosine/adenosine deaminase-related metal-dependent hydrolase
MTPRERSVIKGGLVLMPSGLAERWDIVIEGDAILALVAPGSGPIDANPIDASDRAIMPGLVNAHVHGHGTLAKGLRRLQPLVAQFCRSFACQPYHVHRLACDPVERL